MGNPSTVWTQLSLPNPPVGSVPFVDVDAATIITDVLHFFYLGPNASSDPSKGQSPGQLFLSGGLRLAFQDRSANYSNLITIDKPAGRFLISPGFNTVTINNSFANPGAIVLAQVETVDATLTSVTTAVSDWQIFVTGNANATAPVKVSFVVVNTYTGAIP